MQKLRLLLAAFALPLLLISVTACEDEDDDNVNVRAFSACYIGQWQFVNTSVVGLPDTLKLSINDDGTYVWSEIFDDGFCGNDQISSGTYGVKDTDLHFSETLFGICGDEFDISPPYGFGGKIECLANNQIRVDLDDNPYYINDALTFTRVPTPQ